MMADAEAYAAEIYKDEPDNFHTDEQLCETINDFCAGWRAADNSMTQPDRQHYRIQAAIAAMQGMLANPSHHKVQVESGVPFSNFYGVNAVQLANALIAELQKGGGQDERDRN